MGNTSAIGVEAISSGDAKVYVGGNVTVEAINGVAIGVAATGDGFSLATVEGSVTAVGQQAVGAIAEGRYAYVFVGGNIIAVGSSGSAIGAAAISDYQSDVFVGGNVTAISVGGTAYGVLAEALDGNVEVNVQGGVTAESFGGGDAVGVAGIATGDVSIVVYGTTAALGNIADGILAESLGGGSLFIDVGNVTVNQGGGTSSDSGAGIRSYTTGTTHIYADFVYTVGNYTDGIKAGSIGGGGGNTYVDVYGVKTKGAYSTGVDVYGLGNAGVTSTYIKTYGNNSDGIIAVSTAGGVTVNSGEVVTYGENSIGIYAAAGGPVVVNSGFVETFGNFAPGVVAVNLGTTAGDTVTVTSGTSITHGAYSGRAFTPTATNGVSVTLAVCGDLRLREPRHRGAQLQRAAQRRLQHRPHLLHFVRRHRGRVDQRQRLRQQHERGHHRRLLLDRHRRVELFRRRDGDLELRAHLLQLVGRHRRHQRLR